MDAARTARRMGAEPLIVYRRTREQMPAHEEEAEDAEREGVEIHWLRTISTFEGPELQVEVMELDETGYPQPTGRYETLAADTVILALGQKSETEFLREVPGVEIDARRNGAGVADDGDRMSRPVRRRRHGAERDDRDGRRRARQEGRAQHRRLAARCRFRGRGEARPASFDKLHLWYFGDNARRQQPELALEERISDFGEVVGGLTVDAAVYEAAAASRAATASSATAASARARRTP